MPDRLMRVPVFLGDGRLEFQDRSVPHIQHDDDVLLAVEACGLCGTDLNILAIPPAHKAAVGTVLGHEFVGMVRRVGQRVTGLNTGDRVVISPRLNCGLCRYCRRGMLNQCESYKTLGIHLDGGLAPYCVAPERALYRIDPKVALEDAAFAEVLSCVLSATMRVPVNPGDTIVILGAGPVGLLFAQLYRAGGAGKIIATDVSPFRLDFASRCGVDAVINSNKENVEEVVAKLVDLGADIVVDAVGNLLPQAAKLARRGARIVLFGLQMHALPPVSQYLITRHELTVFGAFVGINPFPQTVRLLESGVIRPSALITHRMPVANVVDAVNAMREGETMKVIVEHPKEV
ncbi:MAG: alcohol dehydrogenase catalytic domain-containing protein [Terriglobia bacterium]